MTHELPLPDPEPERPFSTMTYVWSGICGAIILAFTVALFVAGGRAEDAQGAQIVDTPAPAPSPVATCSLTAADTGDCLEVQIRIGDKCWSTFTNGVQPVHLDQWCRHD